MNDTPKQKGQKNKKTYLINNREKQYDDNDTDMTFELYSNVGVKDNSYNVIAVY